MNSALRIFLFEAFCSLCIIFAFIAFGMAVAKWMEPPVAISDTGSFEVPNPPVTFVWQLNDDESLEIVCVDTITRNVVQCQLGLQDGFLVETPADPPSQKRIRM